MGETTQKVGKTSILSVEERRGLVRTFVNAYLRGSVKITLWLGTKQIYWLSTHQAASSAQIGEIKATILRDISIVSGATPSAPDVIDHSIDRLFDCIVSLRAGDFIEGEFLQSPDLEARLSSLQERVVSLEKLLEELQHIWKIRGPQP
jgi:hypothetical protein